MLLRDYIEWAQNINEYEQSPRIANPSAWGFKNLGKVELPQIKNLKQPIPGNEGYSSIRDELLTRWARYTWPYLKCVDAKIQIQNPGQECKPHLDFLGHYLKNVCETIPGLLQIDHSLDSPGVDVWRMFVAIDDQVDGQKFVINNKHWIWKSGDCIRLNNWQALHYTKNKSKTNRSIIKVTGIKT